MTAVMTSNALCGSTTSWAGPCSEPKRERDLLNRRGNEIQRMIAVSRRQSRLCCYSLIKLLIMRCCYTVTTLGGMLQSQTPDYAVYSGSSEEGREAPDQRVEAIAVNVPFRLHLPG